MQKYMTKLGNGHMYIFTILLRSSRRPSEKVIVKYAATNHLCRGWKMNNWKGPSHSVMVYKDMYIYTYIYIESPCGY